MVVRTFIAGVLRGTITLKGTVLIFILAYAVCSIGLLAYFAS